MLLAQNNLHGPFSHPTGDTLLGGLSAWGENISISSKGRALHSFRRAPPSSLLHGAGPVSFVHFFLGLITGASQQIPFPRIVASTGLIMARLLAAGKILIAREKLGARVMTTARPPLNS